MSIYTLNGKTLATVRERKFVKEKELQTLVEENLQELFGLEFIATEFAIENYFIDTLAFDPELNSFVILEYKRDKSLSVVDQGLHYLSLLLRHKADFLHALMNKRGKLLQFEEIDWRAPRVLFLARSFSSYQIGSTGFRDFPIELWQVTRYENDILDLELIESPYATDSLSHIVKTQTAQKVTQEIKEYTSDEIVKMGDDKTQELFEQIRTRILALDEIIKENPTRSYVAFRFHGSNFVYVGFKKNRLDIAIRIPQFTDPGLPVTKNKVRGWDTTPSWRVEVASVDQIRKLMDLIEQSYTYYSSKY